MRQAVLGVTALVLLSSCGGGGGPADPAAPVVTVEGVKVTPQSLVESDLRTNAN